MNILVTGGAGFIGSHFLDLLLEDNAAGVGSVICLDLLTYAGRRENFEHLEANPNFNFVEGGIGDAELVADILSKNEIDWIVNFAAETHVDRSIDGPDAFVQTNVVGTHELLKQSLRYFKTLSSEKQDKFRFLHVSTDEVFGSLDTEDPAFTEETPYSPNSPYSATKAASDHMVRAYYHTFNLPTIITNCSNNYGPRQFPEKLIPLMILNALENKPLPIYGDGKNIRDWLYVKDHCEGILAAVRSGIVGSTYCIGGNCEKNNLEIVGTVCTLVDELRPKADGTSSKELITFVKDRPGHDRRYAIDASHIKNELGFSPKETFESGFKKTIEWYLSNGAWVEAITNGTYDRKRLGL